MRLFITLFSFLGFIFIANSQVQQEKNAPDHLKSIIFKGETEDQFPIVPLGKSIFLEFDDLTASEEDFYYKVVHCNYNWTPSKLLKSQYLNGNDNQRILNYENSYSTLQAYSNYQLRIPNKNLQIKISGNYMLEVYNDVDELQFSRRFVVFKDNVSVGVAAKRSRNLSYIDTKQNLQIKINANSFQLVNPKQEVKIAIIQNYYWPSIITNIKPQYILGQQIQYKYDSETSFYGGNEYLNFDTSDLRATSTAISHVEMKELYNHYLYSDLPRNQEPYTYFPDINGDFVINTKQGDDASREAEYTNVHFKFPFTDEIGMNDVYVFGKFNNYALSEENKMTYNENTGNLEAIIKLKQGFYNYKYVIKDKKNQKTQLNAISGNFHFTENNYLVLVYYRNFGEQFDTIIGIGNGNSSTLTN